MALKHLGSRLRLWGGPQVAQGARRDAGCLSTFEGHSGWSTYEVFGWQEG